MKDSDLRREKFKKGVIVSGIAVGAAATTAGAAVAATRAFASDGDVPDADTTAAEDGSEYVPEIDAVSQSDDAESVEPVYTVSTSSQVAPAPVTQPDANAGVVVAVDAEPVLVDPEPVEEEPNEEFDLVAVEDDAQSYDTLITTAEQSGNFTGTSDLVEVYTSGADVVSDGEVDFSDVYYADGLSQESLNTVVDPIPYINGDDDHLSDDFAPIDM